ncbi:MAG: DUF2911 domain-containing protein [Lutibacter sp.]|nr:MAG: hypothetical protein APF83_04425 [Lutibacter sp. BRH_c52]HCE55829.1 hypothetical protein [Lutibacter sp.]
MKKFKLLFLLLLVTAITFAQESPRKQATGKIGAATAIVDYGSPSVKGRTIWGELVPYGKVWRAGANENTTFSFDKDVKIGNTKIKAGKYGFFIIPNENKEWVIILNSKNDAWGSNGYNQELDVLRMDVKPINTETNQEALDYAIGEKEIVIKWAKVKIVIPVQ